MPTVVMEGYMFKQGAVVKNWKRRWFVLDSHDNLRYYKDEDRTKEAGARPVFCVLLCMDAPLCKCFVFRLTQPVRPAGSMDMTKCTGIIAGSRCVCQWDAGANINYCFGLVFKTRTYHVRSCMVGLFAAFIAKHCEMSEIRILITSILCS